MRIIGCNLPAERPLGAYFRVTDRDLVAMHAAMTEAGILYATASVHDGSDSVGDDGLIPEGKETLGGHAFAIVAYDHEGFWIQNSRGEAWGSKGLGRLSYDNWLANGTDVWVARLGVPVELRKAESIALAGAALRDGRPATALADLRPHVISIGNDGCLRSEGQF